MESKELVQRIRDCKDRRIVRIKSLEKGNQILQAVLVERCKFLDYALKDVSEDDKNNFTQYLDVLQKAYTEGK